MESQQSKNSISGKIIAAAKSGRLKMRPKWHFVLRAVLWLVGTAAAALALLYFFSLLAFITRETGIWMAPMFGGRGVLLFLASLPWMLVLLIAVFVAVLEILVRRYAFAYRLPLLYSAFGVLFLVVAGGIILSRTSLHQTLSHCPPIGDRRPGMAGFEDGPRPCGTGIYRDLGPGRFGEIHYGVIESFFGDNDFTLINRQQEQLEILVTRMTRLPFGEDFSEGDAVVVIGDRRGDRVEAFGVSKADR